VTVIETHILVTEAANIDDSPAGQGPSFPQMHIHDASVHF